MGRAKVEINADKPGEANIWRKGDHKDADTRALTWSERLKRVAQVTADTLGGTAAKVQKRGSKSHWLF